MVYKICNRNLYRGFHFDATSRKTITRSDGKQIKGYWITGSLFEIPIKVPDHARPELPILCLMTPGKVGSLFSERRVCPETISQFSGTFIDCDWDVLSKAAQATWLKKYRQDEWNGVPVYEGDIFYHRVERKLYIVEHALCSGFSLVSIENPNEMIPWQFDLLSKKGSLWAPPQGLSKELICTWHKRRDVAAREEAINLMA